MTSYPTPANVHTSKGVIHLGKTSKPLTIHIDATLYTGNELSWDALRDQGHDIGIIKDNIPDLYLAPYAMRMTPDMLLQLPSAFTLAMAGARALRYGPTAKDTGAWKGAKKSAKGKGTHKRKNTKVKIEASNTGEPTAQGEDQGTGGGTVIPTGKTTNHEGATQTE